jgi:tetratricopeptide (TPR) repeat protein
MKIEWTIVTCLIVCTRLAAAAELDAWVGRKVMPREDCRVMSGRQVVDERKITLPMTVHAVRDGWLDIGPGYVQPSDVVDFESAAEYYSEVIRRDPQSDKAYNQRAAVRHKQGDLRKAIADYDVSIRLDPRDATAYANRALAAGGLGDYESAVRDYQIVIQLDPHGPWGYNGLAWLRSTCTRPEFRDGKQAVELARQACRYGRNNLHCLSTLAAALAEAGDFAQAVAVQEQAIAAAHASDHDDLRRALRLYSANLPYRDNSGKTTVETAHSSASR